MTKEALESAAEQINGCSPPSIGVDHDPTLPPIGKVVAARVEKTDDGEYKLVITQEIFEDQTEILLDGKRVIRARSRTDKRPFAGVERTAPDRLTLSYDRVNFESLDSMKAFRAEVDAAGECEHRGLVRKSLIPEPELLIKLSVPIIMYLGQKIIDKVTDAGLDGAWRGFRGFLQRAIPAALRHSHPKGRPVTYVFEVPGDPMVQYVARSADPNQVLGALTEEKVCEGLQKAASLRGLLGADKVQFLLNEQGDWEFNYLLTKTGEVIGTPESFDRSAKKLELVAEASKAGSDACQADSSEVS
jgi:hypothetical protein